jgi:hypothetical protein
MKRVPTVRNLFILLNMSRMTGRRHLEQKKIACSVATPPADVPGRFTHRSLIQLNDLDPETWLIDALQRIVSGRTKNNRLHELLAWDWKAAREAEARSATQGLFAYDKVDQILREDGRSDYVDISTIDGLIAPVLASPA